MNKGDEKRTVNTNRSGTAVPSGGMRAWLGAFIPAPLAVDAREQSRTVLGAFLGMAMTAATGVLLADSLGASGGSGALALLGPSAWIVAPLGASCVLVFAAPGSPLAQPWPVIGGNTVSALIGVACATLIPNPVVAGALAVALAIAAMFWLRCLHPPGGAMALLAVLLHDGHGQLGIGMVAFNSLVLVVAGLLYNPLTGRRYPHRQVAAIPAARPITRFRAEDLDAVLARYNQVLDVSRDDLDAILSSAELEAYRRRTMEIRCRDLMSRDVATVEYDSTLGDAWALMRDRHVKALPVVDKERRVVGILTMADFLGAAQLEGHGGFVDRIRGLLTPGKGAGAPPAEVVGHIMAGVVRTVEGDRHAVELMQIFADGGHHHIPVVDADQRLVGIIAQSDFVRALYQRT